MISIVLFLNCLLYILSIIALYYGFFKIKHFKSFGLKPITKFTIIVPFRNEAANLPILLESISKLNYPLDLFEVILVDDDSTEKIQISNFKFQISVINNVRKSNSPKKDAIRTAMELVTTNWVITTDADCIVPQNWLLTYDNYIQQNELEMLAGAVTHQVQDSFLHHFQQLDLASLQAATIGGFGLGHGFMCNGANFGYTKTFFHELNGFDGNDKIASGDDVFLLQKAIIQSAEKVHYLKSKEAIVSTQPVSSWKLLFYQRVRWASKASSYQSRFAIGLGFAVIAGNFAIVLGILFLTLGLFTFQSFIFVCLSKFIVDSIMIYDANRFLSGDKIRYLLLSSLIYPFFNLSVALYSLFGKYEWKGRVFKK
ncbi:glycosyltransferase [Flavobacterium sp. NG2]|uniref:glycosyltransferase family 2 protein n=1 Tax=Flavobacterium sp. NG2 TaxID=3097547 RepID=UPI002A81B601|nr:glycosyltransferase [Flavobacterium sp. NG2]WPR72487.1 glycosyltransferase [Flavobacterium sp. NG2]